MSTKDPVKENENGLSTEKGVQDQLGKVSLSEAAVAPRDKQDVTDSRASHEPLAGGGRSSTQPATETNSLTVLATEGSREPMNGTTLQESTGCLQNIVDYNNLQFSQSPSCVKFASADLSGLSSSRAEAGSVQSEVHTSRTEPLDSHRGLPTNEQVSSAAGKDCRTSRSSGSAEGLPASEVLPPKTLTPKEATKENEAPSLDSLLDISQEISFAEEPVTDALCTAAVPSEEALAEKDGHRVPSKRRNKKKRHSKSHSGKPWKISAGPKC